MKPLLTLAVLGSLFVWSGCSAEREIERKALWLCQRSHLDNPVLETFPDGHAPSEYLSAQDLAALSAENDDKSGALFAAMQVSLQKVGVGAREAFAEHTECKVSGLTLDETGEVADLHVSETRPVWEMPNGLQTVGELAQLENVDDVKKEVNEMMDASVLDKQTVEHAVKFVKQDGRWVAQLDIEKLRKRAKLDSKIEGKEKELAAMRAQVRLAQDAALELAKLRVKESKFSTREAQFGPPRPLLEISVENKTDRALSRVTFVGRLESPGRTVPWLVEDFNYEIPGGLEPGEAAQWSLAPNPFSAWGSVEVPPDVELHLEVVRLHDAVDGVIAEIPSDPKSFRTTTKGVKDLNNDLERLTSELQELQGERDALL